MDGICQTFRTDFLRDITVVPSNCWVNMDLNVLIDRFCIKYYLFKTPVIELHLQLCQIHCDISASKFIFKTLSNSIGWHICKHICFSPQLLLLNEVSTSVETLNVIIPNWNRLWDTLITVANYFFSQSYIFGQQKCCPWTLTLSMMQQRSCQLLPNIVQPRSLQNQSL